VVSANSNEVGVIVNPTASEFPKVSFSINLAVFLASGPARVKPMKSDAVFMKHLVGWFYLPLRTLGSQRLFNINPCTYIHSVLHV
jgi:hypothetical protein